MAMKPIDSILHALEVGASDADKAAAYAELKSLLHRHFAEKPEALTTLEQYEQNPDLWKPLLTHLLAETAGHRDEGILKASEALVQVEKSNIGVIGDRTKVEGDIILGDQIRIESTRDAVFAKGGGIAVKADHVTQKFYRETPSETRASLRTAYLNRVLTETGSLYLEGIDRAPSCDDADSCLNLHAVYTALLTRTSEAEKDKPREFSSRGKPLSALAVLNKHRKMVLLGDPGSGKSTFVNFAALCMAGQGLGRGDMNLNLLTAPLPNAKGDDAEERQPWEHGVLLPVRVILRDFAARGLPDVGQKAGADHLWQFIVKELESAAMKDYAAPLYRELQEKGGLLLLDGLDEVPEADRRRVQIRQVVEDFIRTFHQCRVMLTSRTYAYQKQDWRIPGLPEAVLAPFSKGQIHRFADRWYAHISEVRGSSPENAQGRAVLLKRAVLNSERLTELARRPLLLTLMASLHASGGGSLPENREELYADAVDLLLDWWEKAKIVRDQKGRVSVVQPSLTEWLNTDRKQIRTLLNRLAYKAHANQSDLTGTADISENDLVGGLMRLSANPDVRPKQLVLYLSQRAGLLGARGVGVYTFHHRTFQEYLAACHLTDSDFPTRIAALSRNDPDRWREVCLLAGAKAARGADFAVWVLAETLCDKAPDDPDPDVSESDVWGAHLAGQTLAETADTENISTANQRKLDRVKAWLLRIMEENLLPAAERAIAGNNLSVLGDPRFDPDMFYLPKDEELGFVRIPAGAFLMGSDKKQDDDDADGDEFPQHRVKLSEYHISRYPVTVAQFRFFMQETGHYTDKNWEQYNIYDNHPLVNVSWEDAVAYCKWLTEKLSDRGWQIRLPTEAEWEKAARGTDRRIYPWGDGADPDKANYDDTGIGMTSAVGCFPKGESPYGLQEMSGNVWEWCRDWYGDYPSETVTDPVGPEAGSRRVGRGGGYFGTARHCRSADRGGYVPGLRIHNLGFRLLREAP